MNLCYFTRSLYYCLALLQISKGFFLDISSNCRCLFRNVLITLWYYVAKWLLYVFTIFEQRIICPNVLKSRPRGCKCIFSKPIKKLKLSKLTKWLSIGMTNFWDILSRSFVCNLRLRKQIIVDAYLVCIEFTFDRDKHFFWRFERQFFSKFKQIQIIISCIQF